MGVQAAAAWPEQHVPAIKILSQVLRGVGGYISFRARTLKSRESVLSKPRPAQLGKVPSTTSPLHSKQGMKVREAVLLIFKRDDRGFHTRT